MANALDRVPVNRITAEARQIHPGRAVLAVFGGLLYAVGWVLAKIVVVVWLAAVWVAAAVKVGWQDARPPKSGKSRD